jgi:general secretion pathway protein D
VDLVTNKRTVSTTVLIDDGGIVVLGGLIEDDLSKSESRVPYLGNIPILGLLFKTRADTSTKNNLMIFIRPKILRDEAQAAYETGLKYNYMQDQQKPILNPHEALPLLPGVPPGKLPPLPPPPPPGTNPGINPVGTSATPATQTPPAGAPAGKSPPAPAPANAPAGATAPNGATATPGPAPENNAVPAAPPPAAGSSTPQGNP